MSYLYLYINYNLRRGLKFCRTVHQFVMANKVRRPQATAKCDLVYFVGGYTLAEVAALRTVQVRENTSIHSSLETSNMVGWRWQIK